MAEENSHNKYTQVLWVYLLLLHSTQRHKYNALMMVAGRVCTTSQELLDKRNTVQRKELQNGTSYSSRVGYAGKQLQQFHSSQPLSIHPLFPSLLNHKGRWNVWRQQLAQLNYSKHGYCIVANQGLEHDYAHIFPLYLQSWSASFSFLFCLLHIYICNPWLWMLHGQGAGCKESLSHSNALHLSNMFNMCTLYTCSK